MAALVFSMRGDLIYHRPYYTGEAVQAWNDDLENGLTLGIGGFLLLALAALSAYLARRPVASTAAHEVGVTPLNFGEQNNPWASNPFEDNSTTA